KKVLELLSPTKEKGKLSLSEIRDLAKKHHLTETPEHNEHLRFTDGDISYFAAQEMSQYELELEFLARRLVRAAAERSQLTIKDAGDWSFFAQSLRGEGLGAKA